MVADNLLLKHLIWKSCVLLTAGECAKCMCKCLMRAMHELQTGFHTINLMVRNIKLVKNYLLHAANKMNMNKTTWQK